MKILHIYLYINNLDGTRDVLAILSHKVARRVVLHHHNVSTYRIKKIILSKRALTDHFFILILIMFYVNIVLTSKCTE
jgi:hypothetical protein